MIIDIVALVVLLVSVLIAFLRGFIRELLTIAGVAGGLVAAYYGAPHLIPIMEGWLGFDPQVEEPQKLFGMVPLGMAAQVLSHSMIFIIVVIVLSILSHLMAETAKSIGLGAVDRTLGVMFGLARGVLLLGLLYLPVHLSVDKETSDEWFKGSQSQFYLIQTADWISGFLPEDTSQSTPNDASTQVDGVKDTARETLERMDLLKSKDAIQGAIKKGYSEEFRKEMDQLFEMEDKDMGSQEAIEAE